MQSQSGEGDMNDMYCINVNVVCMSHTTLNITAVCRNFNCHHYILVT